MIHSSGCSASVAPTAIASWPMPLNHLLILPCLNKSSIFSSINRREREDAEEPQRPSAQYLLLMFYYRNLNHRGTMTLKKHCAPLCHKLSPWFKILIVQA